MESLFEQARRELMLPLTVGYAGPLFAPWPVHRGSVKGPVKFLAPKRKDAITWFHQARAWAKSWTLPGRGRAAVAVLHTLIFDFLDWKTGRLDPSYEAIASRCGYKRSTVAEALKWLAAHGIITWQRRCKDAAARDGRYRLHQDTNAYAIRPPSQWVGFRQAEPPRPDPEAWGAAEVVAEIGDQVAAAVEAGADLKTKLALAELDPTDPFAAVLARHYRAISPPT